MGNALPTATLGRTGLEVTRLGFGAAHRRAMTDAEMEAQLNAVLDAGINFVDTANDYGNSEEMIGRVHPGHQVRLPPRRAYLDERESLSRPP